MSRAAELGKWVAQERAKRSLRGKPLSTTALARFANAYIQHQKLPVKLIHQQEISKLENSTAQAGPKRSQPWWDVLESFIKSGALDELISAAEGPAAREDRGAVVVDFQLAAAQRNGDTLVRTPDGEIVGKIVWTSRP